MGIGAIAGAAGGSLLGNLLNGALNNMYEWQNRGWKSQSEYEDYRSDYSKDISDYFLDKQLAYNTYMSNTAYQRAVQDMQAAGINPASMAGVSAQQAASPSANSVNPSYHTNARMNTSPFDIMNGNLTSSAIMATIAKDHDAARLMASEIIDNARHAHKLEEINESKDLRAAKTDYYDEKARALRYHRLGLDK